ncbi:MAG: hypothetical protein ABI276_05725 [Acidimicrobiales bacterium]
MSAAPVQPTIPAVPLTALARSLAATAPDEPLLVRLTESASSEVGLLPISEIDPLADHPADFLVGFQVPTGWTGLGVVACGQLHHLGPADSSKAALVAVCHLADRTGAQATAVHGAGIEVPLAPAEGRIPDLLQRSLNRPVPEADEGPGSWIEQRWLDAVLWLAAAPGPSPGWPQVAALHPLHPAGRAADPPLLRARARDANERGWAAMSAIDPTGVAKAAGFADPSGLGPVLFEWVSPGVVGRWLLQQFPPAVEMIDAIDALVSEHTASAIRRALHGHGGSAEDRT